MDEWMGPQATHVIGGGPVGLTTALLLARAGRRVILHEAKSEVPLSDDNSFPIGVNPRGIEALRRIDPGLVERLRGGGVAVSAWHIHAGRRRVARLAAGDIVATTRARLTGLLLEAAAREPGVEVVTGRSLRRVDLAERRLVFEDAAGAEVVVEAGGARVVCADGVWSAARQSMVGQLEGFAPEVGDWGVRFRVLFSRPGAAASGMDPSVHYIFGGKGMYTATLRDDVWCVAVTAIAGSAEESLLLSDEGTPENVRALQAYVEEHAPLAAPLLTDDDYAAYFARGSFTGAVVRCPFVNVGEWLVLVGDAAHSVIPPTGEGVNSGLEDACLLAERLASGSATPFADYNAARMPDLTALGEYAWHLMENVRTTDPARKGANLVLRILGQLGKPFGREGVEERLFGPKAGRTPYREVFAPWIAQRDRLFPVAHRVARAIGGLRSRHGVDSGEEPHRRAARRHG